MVKSDLINKLSEMYRLPKSRVRDITSDIISIICDSIVDGEKTYLVGLGTFEKYIRKSTTRRHPVTGKAVKIKDTVAVSFRAASALKRKLNDDSNG